MAFILDIPFEVRMIILFVAGSAALGSLCNWAIYPPRQYAQPSVYPWYRASKPRTRAPAGPIGSPFSAGSDWRARTSSMAATSGSARMFVELITGGAFGGTLLVGNQSTSACSRRAASPTARLRWVRPLELQLTT